MQPASGDAGGAVGSALAVWHNHLNNKRVVDRSDKMKGSYLGPKVDNKTIINEFYKIGAVFKLENNEEELIRFVAKEISKGSAIGWFQGRMEFGPRALGGRSIIADPRSDKMQKILNQNILVKYIRLTKQMFIFD